jgi:hypothetical protein
MSEDEEDLPGAGDRLQAPTRGHVYSRCGTAAAAIHDPSTHGRPVHRSGRGARARLVRVLATTFRCSHINLQPTAQPGHRQARGGRGSRAPSCGAAGTPGWLEGPTAMRDAKILKCPVPPAGPPGGATGCPQIARGAEIIHPVQHRHRVVASRIGVYSLQT